MKLKTNLHFHAKEDPLDGKYINYSLKQAIDRASEEEFSVLAFTFHCKFHFNQELSSYAQKRDILLIPGIEQYIDGAHVVVLNCDEGMNNVHTFSQLREHKKKNSGIFIIAPHPYFPGPINLKEKLEKNIDLFDAIEFSWFYSTLVDKNKKARKIAEEYKLPYIATSDTHNLKYLNNSYAIIESKEKTILSVLEAIKNKQFNNISQPASFLKDIIWELGIKMILAHPLIFLSGEKIYKESKRSL